MAAASETPGLSWELAQPIWQAASEEFALDAAGNVQAFVGPAATPSSIFWTTEFPVLLQNSAVRGIDI